MRDTAKITDLARALLGLGGQVDGMAFPKNTPVIVEGCLYNGIGCDLQARQGGTGEVFCRKCNLRDIEIASVAVRGRERN